MRIATTVKIQSDIYDNFKILRIQHKLTLQGLIEKTIYRYVNEESFRNGMNIFIVPQNVNSIITPPTHPLMPTPTPILTPITTPDPPPLLPSHPPEI